MRKWIQLGSFLGVIMSATLFLFSCQSTAVPSNTHDEIIRVGIPRLTMPTPPLYNQNFQGQCYGSLGLLPAGLNDAQSFLYAPELIAVCSCDGKEGYVYKTDFFSATTEGGGRKLDLYEIDGKTLVGYFEMG